MVIIKCIWLEMTCLVCNVSQTELGPILSGRIKHYNCLYSGSTDDVDIYFLHVIYQTPFYVLAFSLLMGK